MAGEQSGPPLIHAGASSRELKNTDIHKYADLESLGPSAISV